MKNKETEEYTYTLVDENKAMKILIEELFKDAGYVTVEESKIDTPDPVAENKIMKQILEMFK